MSANKITLSNINSFNVSNATLSLTSGNIILSGVTANPVTLSARFSLPRSTVDNFGSRLLSFAFNYTINTGSITGVTTTLSRSTMEDAAAINPTPVPLNAASPAFTTTSGTNNNRPVFAVTTPDFDNQSSGTTVIYTLSLAFTFGGTLNQTNMTISGLEIEYDYTAAEPSPTNSQVVYVNKGGNDTTGNGSEAAPFLTISAALASISDAGPTKRYSLMVGPGTYSENITLPANHNLNATAPAVAFSGTLSINHSSWTVSGDNRSSVSNITFTNGSAISLDFTLAPASDGKLAFNNCTFINGLTVEAAASSNEVTLNSCVFTSGALTTTGGVVTASACTFLAGLAFEANSKTAATTTLNLYGGTSTGGDVRLIHTDTHANLTGNVVGFTMKSGAIDARGTGTTANISSGAVTTPILTTGTPTINLVSKATGLGFEPGVPEHWFDVPPSTVQQALDRIVASLQGGTPVFSWSKRKI